MRIVTGNVVTGDDFFEDRIPIVEELGRKLTTSDILVLGPRRTGKTSLIKEFLRQQHAQNPEFKSIFINLESTQNLYDFYIRVIMEILRAAKKWRLYLQYTEDSIKKFSTGLSNVLDGRIDISAILGLPSEAPIAINIPKFEPKKIVELNQYLQDIIHSISTPLVIVMDEFPELIWKLGREMAAEDQLEVRKEQTAFMLAGLRTLRQEADGNKAKHKIIIAGSVNLISTLEHLNLDGLINDIERIIVPDLTPEQGVKLFRKLGESADFHFTASCNIEGFIKDQFGATSPFYIQVFAQALVQLKIDRGNTFEFSEDDLITCYKKLITAEGGQGPRYLKNRIERYYTPQEQILVDAILEVIAHNQFRSGNSTSEGECLTQAMHKTKLQLSRKQQTDLLAKMKADDLLQITGDNYHFASKLLGNFWHYTLVGTDFLSLRN